MKNRAKQQKYFAVCINNRRYEASLERGKLYRVIPADEEAEAHGYLRVVDEIQYIPFRRTRNHIAAR